MRVICINDKNLPLGANVVKDKEYSVLEKFINSYDQIVYIISGVTNKGTTRFGLPWEGYAGIRFALAKPDEKKEKEEQGIYTIEPA
tara:strand:- start:1438 stop:1695 length:258 start_codon:yes stop_codon:yes gene_type:complete